MRKIMRTTLIACLLLLPGMAVAASCSSPTGAEGMLRYNSSDKKLYFCNGTTWTQVGASAATTTVVVPGQPTDQRMYGMPMVGAAGNATPVMCTGALEDSCGGGLFAGDGNLVVAPGGCSGTDTSPTCPALPGATDVSSGFNWKNTNDDSGVGNNSRYGYAAAEATANSAHPAFNYCKNLVYGGYSDWYLPTAYEMGVLYNGRYELYYFGNSVYWTSSEADGSRAWYIDMGNGSTGTANKNTNYRVRCVRRN